MNWGVISSCRRARSSLIASLDAAACRRVYRTDAPDTRSANTEITNAATVTTGSSRAAGLAERDLRARPVHTSPPAGNLDAVTAQVSDLYTHLAEPVPELATRRPDVLPTARTSLTEAGRETRDNDAGSALLGLTAP